jgi:peptide/nickel transport system permease protein
MVLTRTIALRLLLGAVTLLVVSVLIFVATQALPGNAARAILGNTATPQKVAELEQQLGLNRPVVTQYMAWISHALSGNLGHSFVGMNQPVTEVIGQPLFNSLVLVILTALISVPISIGVGVYAAVKRDGLADRVVTSSTVALAALPEFVIGILLIVLLATQVFHLLPPIARPNPGVPFYRQLRELVLPVLTLTLAVFPYISRMMRANTIEILESEYVAMARLKGLPEHVVIWRHAVPNAIVPAIQGTAMQLAWLAGGIVAVEYVFAYPGIGSGLLSAITERDIPVVQAITLILAAVYVLLNLSADVITILVSPRLRSGLQ